MTNEEIVEKVYQFFIDTYQLKFNGDIKLKTEPGFYDLNIFLNEQYFRPMHIMMDTDDPEIFLKYIYKELYDRKLYMHNATKFTSIKLTADQI